MDFLAENRRFLCKESQIFFVYLMDASVYVMSFVIFFEIR